VGAALVLENFWCLVQHLTKLQVNSVFASFNCVAGAKGAHREDETATTATTTSAPPTLTNTPPRPVEENVEPRTTDLSLAEQVARVREHVTRARELFQPSTDNQSSTTTPNSFHPGGVSQEEDPEMREENALLRKKVELLESQVKQLTERVTKLEVGHKTPAAAPTPAPKAAPCGDSKKVEVEDEDDVDLFGSDDEETSKEAAALKEKRLADYAAKKAKSKLQTTST